MSVAIITIKPIKVLQWMVGFENTMVSLGTPHILSSRPSIRDLDEAKGCKKENTPSAAVAQSLKIDIIVTVRSLDIYSSVRYL